MNFNNIFSQKNCNLKLKFQERISQRKEYFKTMDKSGKGLITLNDWLDYANKHIIEKVTAFYFLGLTSVGIKIITF